MADIVAESEITCPDCGYREVELMLHDACQFFYDCQGVRGRATREAGRLLRVLLVRDIALPADLGAGPGKHEFQKIKPGPEGPGS